MENNIIYQVLTKEDLQDTILCISEVFSSDEPLTSALHITRDDFYQFAEIICTKAVADGLSHIAKDINTGRVVGFRISEDLIPDNSLETNTNFDQLVKFQPIIDLIRQLEEQYTNSKSIQVGEVFHLSMLGVNPNYRQQNIAKNLMLENLKLAQERKFKVAICEVTGLISQHNARKIGFKEVVEIAYKDYTYQGVKVFAQIKPHPSCILMEKHLYL